MSKIRLAPGPFVLPMPTVLVGADTVYFGEVVGVYADEDALTDGVPDWAKPDKRHWRLGAYVAEAWSVGKRYVPSA